MTGHAVDDRNIAGKEIGQLLQEEARQQIVHQPLVEKRGTIFSLRGARKDGAVDSDISLPSTRGDDHVHTAQNAGVAFDTRRVQRGPCRVRTDLLSNTHLTLIAFPRNLFSEIDRAQRMNKVRRILAGIGRWPAVHEAVPMRLRTFTQT